MSGYSVVMAMPLAGRLDTETLMSLPISESEARISACTRTSLPLPARTVTGPMEWSMEMRPPWYVCVLLNVRSKRSWR